MRPNRKLNIGRIFEAQGSFKVDHVLTGMEVEYYVIHLPWNPVEYSTMYLGDYANAAIFLDIYPHRAEDDPEHVNIMFDNDDLQIAKCVVDLQYHMKKAHVILLPEFNYKETYTIVNGGHEVIVLE